MVFGSPKEHALYANKINELLQNATARIGSAAREKAIAKFSIAVVAKQSMDFINLNSINFDFYLSY
jgi:glycosyltransferase involved in cell wall biosynthesis